MQAYKPIVPFDVLSKRLGRDAKDIIKLDANENPYGPSPQALAALAALPYSHIYPDPENIALRAALAHSTGLPAENLFAGGGSDEIIDLIMRLFLQPGDFILDCPPTFGMFSFDAAVNGARVIEIPRRPDFSLDLEAIESFFATPLNAHAPKLFFIASPNNPTGTVTPDADLRRLLKLSLVIVLDEAYIEFHGESKMRWVLEHDNLIVLRTFSKRAGLAGLRVGYGAFPVWLMPYMWKIKQPYNVNVAATAAALASLADEAYLNRMVALLTAERDRLSEELSEIPYLRPIPSRANFVLCRVVGREAKDIQTALEHAGILIRHFNKPYVSDCIRISAGKPEHTDALLEALRKI
jgi:histidinol-phosphate aminotransferase